jgi:hypothetical protein
MGGRVISHPKPVEQDIHPFEGLIEMLVIPL